MTRFTPGRGAEDVNPDLFKAYNIRGLHGSEMDETTAPAMAGALGEGLVAEGATVIDAGQVATEMLYHLVGSREFDGGAMCTASHSPKAYTGVKLVRDGALSLSGDAGIGDVKAEIEGGLGEARRDEVLGLIRA